MLAHSKHLLLLLFRVSRRAYLELALKNYLWTKWIYEEFGPEIIQHSQGVCATKIIVSCWPPRTSLQREWIMKGKWKSNEDLKTLPSWAIISFIIKSFFHLTTWTQKPSTRMHIDLSITFPQLPLQLPEMYIHKAILKLKSSSWLSPLNTVPTSLLSSQFLKWVLLSTDKSSVRSDAHDTTVSMVRFCS